MRKFPIEMDDDGQVTNIKKDYRDLLCKSCGEVRAIPKIVGNLGSFLCSKCGKIIKFMERTT